MPRSSVRPVLCSWRLHANFYDIFVMPVKILLFLQMAVIFIIFMADGGMFSECKSYCLMRTHVKHASGKRYFVGCNHSSLCALDNSPSYLIASFRKIRVIYKQHRFSRSQSPPDRTWFRVLICVGVGGSDGEREVFKWAWSRRSRRLYSDEGSEQELEYAASVFVFFWGVSLTL